uniref:Cilia- and flagella-associated protein 300 n=1 Tax=Timema poppense TaxID=170557 RepID=A0A7R9DGA8_TIMPO|nr:unnamed protein product [Timema poppensis]
MVTLSSLRAAASRSLKGHIKIQTYCFNEPFQPYQKNDFAQAFFKDDVVIKTLECFTEQGCTVGVRAESVEVQQVPCSVVSMSFFNPLTKPDSGIVTSNDSLVKCPYDEIGGFTITDELRKMFLDEDSSNYKLMLKSDRNEFIFRLFQAICLGGQWCQYEDTIKPYLDTTKCIYKDLVSVQKDPTTKDIFVSSVVLQVVARGSSGVPYYPSDPEHIQNFAYLIIDPLRRQVKTFTHQYHGVSCF